MEKELKKVVVIGGGIAGAFTAKSLEDAAEVTLLDPKDYLEIPYAQLRSTVQPTFAERCLINHADYLKKAKLVTGSAKTVTETLVTTSNGDKLSYDFLVIATGSTYNGPQSRSERLQQFEADNKRLKEAKSILIIGGGPVGVELAGEIVVDFPEKKVTLVHSRERLIEFLGAKASKKALDWLKSKNVQVILNERIELGSLANAEGNYSTDKGTTITADTHFVCIGKKVGSAWIKESPFFENKVDDHGRLKVDKQLHLEEKTNVFVAGDVANTAEIKQGFLAQKHADVVASNIKKSIKNTKSALSSYKPLSNPFGIVSLGRCDAVAQLPFVTLVGCIPGMIKSKDLFIGKTRKELGLAA